MEERRGGGMRLHNDTSEAATLSGPSHQVGRPEPTYSCAASPAMLNVKPLTYESILVLQHRAGNSAVTSLLKPPRSPQGAPETSVQRCPGVCGTGACEGHEEVEENRHPDDSARAVMQSGRSQACRGAKPPGAGRSVNQRPSWSPAVQPLLTSRSVQREEDSKTGQGEATGTDAGATAPSRAEGSSDAGTMAGPKTEQSPNTGEAAANTPTATTPMTLPSGHTPAPPGMAACPDAPARNVVVLACTAPTAKVPPPKEQAP